MTAAIPASSSLALGHVRERRVVLDRARAAIGHERGIQGNLDPAFLLGLWRRVVVAAADIIARTHGRPGHGFNLGHGVLPETDRAVLGRLVELAHEQTGTGAEAAVLAGGKARTADA